MLQKRNCRGRISIFSEYLRIDYRPAKDYTRIKTLGKIARIVLVVCLAAYLLLLFVSSSPMVRRWLAREVAAVATAELGSRVSIGDVEIGLFNRAVLSDVVVEDLQGDTLLSAGRLGAKISWRSLAREKLDIRSVQVLDANIKLYKNKNEDKPNFQFLIDRFSSDEEGAMRPLRLGSVILRRVNLSWDVRDRKETPGRLCTDHIRLENVSASIGLGHISADSVQLRLRELSLREKSGLDIRNLSMRMSATDGRLDIGDLHLVMPGTDIRQPYMTLRLRDAEENAALPFRINADINGWTLAANDFAFLLPALKAGDRKVTLSALVTTPQESLSLRDVYLRETSGGLLLRGDAHVQMRREAMPQLRLKLAELTCGQEVLRDILTTAGLKDIPGQVTAVGDIRYSGTVAYGTSGLEADGKLRTGIGDAEGTLAWSGTTAEADMRISGLKTEPLTGRRDLPTDVSLSVSGRASHLTGSLPDFEGSIDIRHMLWDGQAYEGIVSKGKLEGGRLKASVSSSDPKLALLADVSGNVASLSDIHLNADIRHIGGLNFLPQQFRNASLAGRIRLDLPRWPRDVLEGSLELSDVSLRGWKEDYGLSHLLLSAMPTGGDEGKLTLRSDFADIDMEGPLKPALLVEAAKETGLRAIGLQTNAGHSERWAGKEWRIDANIARLDELRQFLGVPIDMQAPLTLRGNMRADGGRMALTSHVKELSVGGFSLKDARIYLNGLGDSISVLAQAAKEMAGQDIRIAAGISAKEGDISANVKWAGNGTELLHGALQTRAKLSDIAGNKILVGKFIPSEIVIGDTIWRVASDDIIYGNKILDISRFSLSHADQSVHVSGRLSPDPADSIKAHLQKVNIAYILNLVEFDDVSFDGEATGDVNIDRSAGYPKVSGRLDVPDFLFNDAPMGRLDFFGGFDTREKRLDIDGHMNAGGGDFTDVKGYVSLLNKELDLNINGRNTNLSFLQRFVDGIFSDFQGKATGRCHLFGPFKKLDFEGDEMAEAKATIDAIGVNYRLSGGRVKIKPGEFAFSGFTVSDGLAGTGRASGALRHTHLKKINYDFDLESDRLLVYDKPKELDMPFYATAYGTGTLHLQGRPGELEADVNMRPERGTVFTYTVDAPETFGDVKMVSYRDKSFKIKGSDTGAADIAQAEDEGTTDIRLNMLFDVTPDALLKIIMNEKTGDNITVRGNGPIRANFYNKGPFRMYGVFNIDEGNYRMNIQDVIRKDFQLANGGTIAFNGDPYQGDLNMQAIYTVKSASLSDLNIGTGFSQNSVRVNCLLNFSGKVKNPQVDFDLDLPTVNEEEKQLVRNIISTEEDMNMQILYLLGIGRFYTYATPQDGSSMAGSQSAAAMKSFLSSTLSGQLNEIISNAVGSSNWSFGTNVSTGGADTNEFEVEGQLSGRLLSGRLLLNGNIGYRDKSIYNNSSFIGDFDVQYLLTPKGSVRLKAYSETNDRYFTKSSLTTQGIGVQLSRDFTNLRDLFNVKGRNKKKKKQHGSKD